MALTAGDKVGPYEIVAPIGVGGMGEVYRARDARLERDVAIKVLPDALARNSERLARFEREAKVLASLNHPNIAQIYGVEQGSIVMELVEGENLPCPLPAHTAIDCARQIADALEAAHEKGIVHRDLKPANIKVTREGVIKVLDFGLASVAQNTSAYADASISPTLTLAATQMGVLLGTAGYMSPEQAAGKPVDKRADVWSFGVVLWELLSGRRLFDGETVSHTLAAVLTKDPDWTQLPEGVPLSVHRLLRRCLQRDLRRRLPDIGAARLELEDALAGQAPDLVVALPPQTRPKMRWASSLAALLLVAAFTSFGWWRASQPVDHPLVRFSVDLGPEAVTGSSIPAVLSPDARRIVFPIRGADGLSRLGTRLMDQPNVVPLAGTENGRDPFFSPDGQWIGFFADAKLKKVAVLGGTPIVLCDSVAGRGGSWGDDGTIVFAPANTVGLARVGAAGGTPQAVTRLAEGEASHRWPQILPGGNAVLFTAGMNVSRFDDASIETVSLKTGAVKTLVHGGFFGRYIPGAGGRGFLVYAHDGTLFGAAFDPDKLELQGPTAPVLEEIATDSTLGGGQFDFSAALPAAAQFLYLSGKSGGASYPILWLDADGKTTPLLARPGAYGSLRFSPDGHRLAFTALSGKGSDIWIYDLQRDTPTQLTFTAPGNFEMAWAPDGKHIAFGSQSAHKSGIWWTRSDGSGEPIRLLEGGTLMRPQAFSPDGKLLIFDQTIAGNVSIWKLPLDLADPDHPMPSKPEAFLNAPLVEVDSALSPDGRWIAYSSNESGASEVFVRPFPGPGGKWKISTGSGKFPTWSRHTSQLFFLTANDSIMVADYSVMGDSFAPGKVHLWSEARILRTGFFRPFDLAPDGKRFAVFPSPQAEQGKASLHVTFLLNFTDELRRRLFPAGK